MASLLEVSERVEIDSMRRLRIVIESVLVLLLALLLPLRVMFQV
jgi:hypothetical protein